MTSRLIGIVWALACTVLSAGIANGAHVQMASTTHPPGALSAKDAGARYGQAAGAALVCSDLQITPRVAELRARYHGDELGEFDTQAGKVLKAWRQAQTCELADGPDGCRLSQRWSCQQALKDIGPDGVVVRGLVAMKDGALDPKPDAPSTPQK